MSERTLAGRPWLAQYEAGVPHEVAYRSATFHSLLEVAAAGAPGFPAITYLGNERSYAELNAQVGRVAGALARDGVLPGSVVAVALPLCPALFVAVYGALAIGSVVLILDPGGSLDAPDRQRGDLTELLARHDPSLVVLRPLDSAVPSALEAAGVDARLVAVDRDDDLGPLLRLIAKLSRGPAATQFHAVTWRRWLAGARAPVAWPSVSPADPAVVLHTGGGQSTTYTHSQLVAGSGMLRAWMPDALPAMDKWLATAHPSRSFGLTALLGTAVEAQANVVLLSTAPTDETQESVRVHSPAFVVADVAPSARDHEGRLAHGGGSAALRAWITDARQNAPMLERSTTSDISSRLNPTQGSTVSGPVAPAACYGYAPVPAAGLVFCNPVNATRYPGSVGVPLPGADARVVGTEGGVLLPDVVGSLEIRAPNLPSTDQWLRTDDRMSMSEAGVFYAHGPVRSTGVLD